MTTAADLAVRTAGDVIVAGDVRASSLALATTGLLDVETGGSLTARAGGSLSASADYFVNVGQVRADGVSGGAVAITARDYLNAGTVSAAGAGGAGGRVRVGFTESYIDTTTATTTAGSS